MAYELTLKVLIDTSDARTIMERVDTFLHDDDQVHTLKCVKFVTFPILRSNPEH